MYKQCALTASSFCSDNEKGSSTFSADQASSLLFPWDTKFKTNKEQGPTLQLVSPLLPCNAHLTCLGINGKTKVLCLSADFQDSPQRQPAGGSQFISQSSVRAERVRHVSALCLPSKKMAATLLVGMVMRTP